MPDIQGLCTQILITFASIDLKYAFCNQNATKDLKGKEHLTRLSKSIEVFLDSDAIIQGCYVASQKWSINSKTRLYCSLQMKLEIVLDVIILKLSCAPLALGFLIFGWQFLNQVFATKPHRYVKGTIPEL